MLEEYADTNTGRSWVDQLIAASGSSDESEEVPQIEVVWVFGGQVECAFVNVEHCSQVFSRSPCLLTLLDASNQASVVVAHVVETC